MWYCKNINVSKKTANFNDEIFCSLNDTSLEEKTCFKVQNLPHK